MFEKYDIAYCSNFSCNHKDCRRHEIHKPQDDYLVSVAHFDLNEDGSCEYYWRREI